MANLDKLHYFRREQVYNIVQEIRESADHFIKYSSIETGDYITNINQIFNDYDEEAGLDYYFEIMQNDLLEIERVYKDRNNVRGVRFDILLYKEFKEKSVSVKKEIIKKIVNQLSLPGYTLPYVAFPYRHGKSCYLTIIFLDREYYPNEATIPIEAKSDWYFSKETGRRVKEPSEVSNDIELRYKKGDVMSSKKVKFSDKVRHWNASKDTIVAVTERFKLAIIEIFERYFKLQTKRWMKLIQYRKYKGVVDMFIKLESHEKAYWWMIRKNSIINHFIRQLNKIYRLNEEIESERSSLRKQIVSWQFMEVKNLTEFSDMINNLINEIKVRYKVDF